MSEPIDQHPLDAEIAERLRDFTLHLQPGGAGEPPDAERLVAAAAAAVPNAIAAGLTLIRRGGAPTTLAASAPLPAEVEQLEYETGEGPCLEAIEVDDITLTTDLATEDRWPNFTKRAQVETGVRSMFGVRVRLGGDDRGALNFYATEPGVFTELDLAVGALFSTYSSVVLQHAVARHKTEHLQNALESSRQIGMAMGILMASKLLTAEQAFDKLRQASQHLHRKVRDVALDVMETGTLPDLPGEPS